MTPYKPSASEAREPATAISQRLENIMTWLREPDWTEQATLEWIKDWVNRRPIAELAMVAMLMPSRSPAATASLPLEVARIIGRLAWNYDVNDCQERDPHDALEIAIFDLKACKQIAETLGLEIKP